MAHFDLIIGKQGICKSDKKSFYLLACQPQLGFKGLFVSDTADIKLVRIVIGLGGILRVIKFCGFERHADGKKDVPLLRIINKVLGVIVFTFTRLCAFDRLLRIKIRGIQSILCILYADIYMRVYFLRGKRGQNISVGVLAAGMMSEQQILRCGTVVKLADIRIVGIADGLADGYAVSAFVVTFKKVPELKALTEIFVF